MWKTWLPYTTCDTQNVLLYRDTKLILGFKKLDHTSLKKKTSSQHFHLRRYGPAQLFSTFPIGCRGVFVKTKHICLSYPHSFNENVVYFSLRVLQVPSHVLRNLPLEGEYSRVPSQGAILSLLQMYSWLTSPCPMEQGKAGFVSLLRWSLVGSG